MFRKSVPRPPPVEETDDDISVTSTQESEHSEGHEFTVDKILAEKTENRNTLYLIRWEGYEIHRSTWEPRNHICDVKILDEWKTRKSREAKGLDLPFDVEAFEAHLERKEIEKETRRRRRDSKRKRPGVSEQVSNSEDGDSSSDEATERDEVAKYQGTSTLPVKLPAKLTRPKVPVTSGKNTTPAAKATSSAAVPPSKSMKSTQPAPPAKSVTTNKSATSSSDSDAPLVARQQKSGDGRIPKFSNKSGTINPPSKPSTPRGMGAVRGKSNHQNVFARRSPPKNRGQRRPGTTLTDAASDPTKDKVHFKNMHLVRKAEIGSRDKADRAPDVDAVGGLFRAGDAPPIGPLRPIRKISDTLPQTRSLENEDETDRPPIPSSTISQMTLPKGKVTCYYWHHNKGGDNACTKGYLCDYAHNYGEGYPIAEPPPSNRAKELSRNTEGSFEEAEPSVPQKKQYQGTYRCFFYVKRGNCRMGNNCTKLHSDDESIPIAPMKVNETCQYWLHGYCRKTAEDCSYVHGNPDEICAPQRIKANETCPYWLNGHCSKTADECSRIHGYPEDIRAPTQVDFETTPNIQGQKPTARKESLKPICARFLTGYCKFGLTCNLRHERPGAEPESKPEPTKREAPRKSVSFVTEPMDLFEEPLPIARDEANQPRHTQDNEPPPDPPTDDSTTSKPKRTISLKNYTQKKAFGDGARAKKFFFGGNGEMSLVLDIGDLGKNSQEPCGIFLTSIKDIILDQKITAQDLKAQYSTFHKLQGSMASEGNLSPRSENASEETKLIDKVVNYLRHHLCGLVYSSQGFNILVIPARSDDWKFLGLTSCPSDVRLRYLVFRTVLNTTACLDISAPESPVWQKATATNHQTTISEIVHRLDIDRIAPNSSNRRHAFFLFFPDSEEKIATFIADWLKKSRSGCKVYTSDTQGAWNLFLACNSDIFNNGAILLHDSLTPHVDLIPHVQKTLLSFKAAKNKQYSWWSISDGFQHRHILPETHKREEKDRGPIEAIPLLPHGAAILLTQSFFIAEPQKAYDLLKWFFGRIDNDRHKPGKMSSPSPWKIVLPYNIIEYTHDLACAKDAESTRFLEDNRDKPSREADASRIGLGYATCELRFKIYAYLADLKHLGVIDNPKHVWPSYCPGNGREVRDEYRSPVIYAPKYVHTHDEIDLVYWFASWGIQRIDTYRKLVVLGTNTLSRNKLKRLVEVEVGEDVSEEPEHRNPSQSNPPPEPPAVILRIQATEPQLLEPSSASLEKQKALAVAARLNQTGPPKSSTTDGLVAENSGRTHQGDLDVDARILELIGNESSKHPQLRVSTSNLNTNSSAEASAQPQTSPQYSPQFSADSTSSTVPETSKASIKFAIPSKSDSKPGSSATMPPDSETPAKVNGTFQNEWQKKKEPQMEWKEKTYEHTTSWFRNMKTSPERNGILWEHVYVGSWEMVWPLIGFKPS